MDLPNYGGLTGGSRDIARDTFRNDMKSGTLTQRDDTEMRPWFEQVEEVRALGESKLADELIDFARLNTAWPLPD